jgi:hypothetical protein
MRVLMLSAALLATAAEPIVGDADLVRYAITQGGLLAVVLVLLWSYRRDSMRMLLERENRLAVMTELVQASTAALTRSAEACERMARAVENLERRS